MTERPSVLMVTGAYYPELSGAGLQCRTLIRALQDRVSFSVLTTTTDPRLSTQDVHDGVTVQRVFVDPRSRWSKATAILRVWRAFRAAGPVDVVHLHGFSQKSIVLVLLAMALRIRVAIKLTSFGDDDPVAMARRDWLSRWCYRRADQYFAVSEKFREPYRAAGLPVRRLRVIPNGVDTQRFRPGDAAERTIARRALGWPERSLVVLFVGFFSREKQPDVLFDAWTDSVAKADASALLVFVGATRASYHEIDPQLAVSIRERARDRGVEPQLRFVESTHDIEQFMRAADIFVLPSLREGMPNALLEAMASGLACVATRLEGITDAIVTDGRDGCLIPVGDTEALKDVLRQLAADETGRRRLGDAARQTIQTRYAVEQTARQYYDSYKALTGRSCAA